MTTQQRSTCFTNITLIVLALWLGVLGASQGVAAEYAYGGTLDVDQQSASPVPTGGRGDLVGSYPDTGIFFLAFNFTWVF